MTYSMGSSIWRDDIHRGSKRASRRAPQPEDEVVREAGVQAAVVHVGRVERDVAAQLAAELDHEPAADPGRARLSEAGEHHRVAEDRDPIRASVRNDGL